ncbi:MAG: sugar-binding protein [Candidatus Latescibacterota bacterium]
MKISMILPLLFALALPGYSQAQVTGTEPVRPTLDAPFVKTKIAVDGSAAEWAQIKALGKGIFFFKGDGQTGSSAKYGTTTQRIITDEKDLRGDIWMVHDGGYLYVLAEVRDDDHEPFDAANFECMCYQEDMLRIMFDSVNARAVNIVDPIANQYGYEGFGFSTDGNIYGDWMDFNSSEVPKKRPPKGAQPDGEYWRAACKVQKLADGYLYTYEERIKLSGWPGRNMAPMEPGKSYGLNLEICDADRGVMLEGYLLWSSDGVISDYNYQNLWGVLQLAPVR